MSFWYQQTGIIPIISLAFFLFIECSSATNAYQFGLNFMAMDGWADEQVYTLGTNTGAHWSREGIRWQYVELAPGVFDYGGYDIMVGKATQHNVTLLTGLLYTNSFYNTNGAPHTPTEYEAFARYVSNTVDHYKDSIQHWEIWNEPDCDDYWKPQPDATNYAHLLSYAYQAAKTANSNCTILGFGGDSGNIPYIGTLFTNGALTNMDILSVHPYSQPQPFEISWQYQALDVIRSMMQEVGQEKPIWVSEVGYSSFQNVSEQRQAELLIRTHLMLFSKDIPFVITYSTVNGSENTNDVEAMFGLIHTNFVPKLSYDAYQHMISQLADKPFQECYQLGNGVDIGMEDCLFRFSSTTGKTVLTAWTFDEILIASNNYTVAGISQHDVLISYTGTVDAITDLYGSNVPSWHIESDHIIGKLTNTPVYISGTFTVRNAGLVETNAPYPVPLTWLHTYYPFDTNYGFLAISDTDNDDMAAWQEYIVGSIPTNPLSFFKFSNIWKDTISSSSIVLSWEPSVSGRSYQVESAKQIDSSFSNRIETTWPDSSCTDSMVNAAVFYRIRVHQKQPLSD